MSGCGATDADQIIRDKSIRDDRCAKPRWLAEAMKRGKKLDDFLIDKSARKGRKKRRSKR